MLVHVEALHVEADHNELALMASVLRTELLHNNVECTNLQECENAAKQPSGGSRHAETIRIYRTITTAIQQGKWFFTASVPEINVLVFALRREIEYRNTMGKPVDDSHAGLVRIYHRLSKAVEKTGTV